MPRGKAKTWKTEKERALRGVVRRGIEGAPSERALGREPWAPNRDTLRRWRKGESPLDQLLFALGLAEADKEFRESLLALVDPDYPERRERLRELEEENLGLRGRIQELEREQQKLEREAADWRRDRAEHLFLRLHCRDYQRLIEEYDKLIECFVRDEPYEQSEWLKKRILASLRERLVEKTLDTPTRVLEPAARVIAWCIVELDEIERGQPFDEPYRSSRENSVLDVVRSRMAEIRKPG